MTRPRAVAPQLMTIQQVASRLAVSKRTVSRLIEAGDLRVHRLGGGAVRIAEDDLVTFVNSGRC